MSNRQQRMARYWVRMAVATALGTISAASMTAIGAEAAATEGEEIELDEVQVTGSRIVRRDLQSNSPLQTVDRQQLEDSTFISVEQALNDLPQFMAGGVGNSAGAVTGLQAANGLDGGRGSGDMFNMALLPDNAGMLGIVVPGAANVNLRGLGANRSLTLIDGHRGMPSNASMTVDLNTIPTIAISNIEVITGGASAVYGADALAGVTNIRLRESFEGVSLRVRGGVNEVGDGGEYQISGLLGAKLADGRGSAMVGIEYSKREVAYWNNRSFFREAQESPYTGSGDYLFAWEPGYTSSATTGTYNVLQRAWSGNAPNLSAIVPGTGQTVLNTLFGDRTCVDAGVQLNCIADANNAPRGGGWYFNPDGSLYIRASQVTTGTGAASITNYYGPQGYALPIGGTGLNPSEVVCAYTPAPNAASGYVQSGEFAGERCNPTTNRVDHGRWLTSPREGYSLFGRGTFDINENVSVFANFNFASSHTTTRREPAPFSGGFGAVIPFHTTQGGDGIYRPSVITNPVAGQVFGQTNPDYQAGGARGLSCPAMGGCTMSQAFPVPQELRILLESRPTSNIGTTGANASNAFRGLSACNQYILVDAATPGATLNPASGQYYVRQIDPNTGEPLMNCGANAGWQINQQLAYLPPRGTSNTTTLYQFATGLTGNLGFSDWTWEAYMSYGDSQTPVNYDGFSSLANYQKIISAPNYGRGYREEGLNSKTLRCTSGLDPFNPNLVVSADCIEAILSNQVDRNSMQQRIYEANVQGHVADLPAGELRAAMGVTYRKNDYEFTPDAQRIRSYVGDSSAGQFGVGTIDENVTAKEIYGELLVPVLQGLPGVQSLELELGARHSEYSTGQKVATYKALASWAPLDWLRARGGYNRAERAPNLSELYATPSGSSQFLNIPIDPCRNDTAFAVNFPGPTQGSTLNNTATTDPAIRAQLLQLCSDNINFWGTNGTSDFHSTPLTWNVGGGGALITGNPLLKNEKADTWTVGLAFSSPFTHPLASRISGTIDWYEASVEDPIEVQSTGQVINGCFNINGLNPTYSMDDPQGFCKLIERDTSTGGILRVYNTFGNQGKLVIRGVDVSMRWNAQLAEMGLQNTPGALSLSISGNYLIDQIQRYGGDLTDDFAGYNGASRIRTFTALGYNWGRGNRVALNWEYRVGTHVPTTFAVTPAADGSTGPALVRNPLMAGYPTANLFSLIAGTQFRDISASISVTNLLNTKPSTGGYDLRDPRQGLGTFSPFDDLVGRRYSINLSMDF